MSEAGFWQVRATAQFRRLALRGHSAIDARCDPGLKAGQPQCQRLGASPAFGGRRNVQPPRQCVAQAAVGFGLELRQCPGIGVQRLERCIPQNLQYRAPRAAAAHLRQATRHWPPAPEWQCAAAGSGSGWLPAYARALHSAGSASLRPAAPPASSAARWPHWRSCCRPVRSAPRSPRRRARSAPAARSARAPVRRGCISNPRSDRTSMKSGCCPAANHAAIAAVSAGCLRLAAQCQLRRKARQRLRRRLRAHRESAAPSGNAAPRVHAAADAICGASQGASTALRHRAHAAPGSRSAMGASARAATAAARRAASSTRTLRRARSQPAPDNAHVRARRSAVLVFEAIAGRGAPLRARAEAQLPPADRAATCDVATDLHARIPRAARSAAASTPRPAPW